MGHDDCPVPGGRLWAGSEVATARAASGVAWADLAKALGRSLVWSTSALLGQQPLDAAQAAAVGDLLGLDDAVVTALQLPPDRGAGAVDRTDPAIYRLEEAVEVYGSAVAALMAEEFGDGVMSAIDFELDFARVSDPKGDRVVLTEQGPQAHDFSRGSRAFRLPGGVATRMVVSPSCDDVSVGDRSTNKTVYSAKYHVMWCPKYRRGVLAGRVEVRLKEIIFEVMDGAGGEVIEVEVVPDHVHLLAEVPPAVALSKLVQKLKGRSSRLVRAEFPPLRRLAALWSPSWFVSTVGGAPLEVVRRYVENQKRAA